MPFLHSSQLVARTLDHEEKNRHIDVDFIVQKNLLQLASSNWAS